MRHGLGNAATSGIWRVRGTAGSAILKVARTSVLLDWSFTGDGAVGEDVANLIVDSFTDGLMDVTLLPELADRATDGYVNGLRDGGWSGSADSVRTAISVWARSRCGAGSLTKNAFRLT